MNGEFREQRATPWLSNLAVLKLEKMLVTFLGANVLLSS